MTDTILPPLPEADYLLALPDRPYDPGYVTSEDGYTADQMRAYAEAAVAAERERWEAPSLVLWPLVCRMTKDLVFTAERAGEVQAAIEAMRRQLHHP